MIDLKALETLQTINDGLNQQVMALQTQIQDNENKINALRAIKESVDMLDNNEARVKASIAGVYDVKQDTWNVAISAILDDAQRELIKKYATTDLVVEPKAVVAIEK